MKIVLSTHGFSIQGQQIYGLILCEKLLMFNDRLGGDSTFRASLGWLRNFARHKICGLEIHGENLSANSESAEEFVLIFIIKDYNLDFVYNAD